MRLGLPIAIAVNGGFSVGAGDTLVMASLTPLKIRFSLLHFLYNAARKCS
jgi:hypothetical protein